MIDIQKLILKLRNIERITYNPSAGYENDVEHSYSLAMMAWLFGPKLVPHLDQFKLVTYAMIHDLVEVYAGDTFCFGSKEDLASKDSREDEALRRLVAEYADFPNMVNDLESYAEQKDEESRFIYALDKMQGVILNYLDGNLGRMHPSWSGNYAQFCRPS